MMSNFHLCLTGVRSEKELESALRSIKSGQLTDKSDSGLAAIMHEVAEFCEDNGKLEEAGRVESMANKLMSDDEFYSVSVAQHALVMCSLTNGDLKRRLGFI
ncbi:uncharacterized protein LOC141857541 [Brevipalpus obovatus]|uniref:uncharacterized protein LOC141857541 n=1 Tax=Brevipalpus obovatus TaxID=246614 RepID=UPI003D9F2256